MRSVLKSLLILLGVLLIFFFFNRREGKFRSVLETEIRSIEIIIGPGDSLTLEKNNGEWQLLGRPLDMGRLDIALHSLHNLELKDVISYREDRYSNFGVDEASARIVQINEEDKLYIGNRAPDWMSSYIRYEAQGDEESSPVYIARGIMRELFSFEKEEWFDRRVFTFIPGLEYVSLDYAGKTYRIGDNQQILNNFAAKLYGVEAAGFPEAVDADFPFRMTLSYREKGDKHFLITNDNDSVYILNENKEIIYEVSPDEISRITDFIIENSEL